MSVISAINPWSLFASAAPVLITASLLQISHDISLFRIDLYCALFASILIHMLSNLNSIYSTLHRSIDPSPPKTDEKEHRIVINLLSQGVVDKWTYGIMFFVVLLLTIGTITQSQDHRSYPTLAMLVTISVLIYVYCRSAHPIPFVRLGTVELIFAFTSGPIAMFSTSYYLVHTIPWSVVAYSYVIWLFAFAFQVLQTSADSIYAVHQVRARGGSLTFSLGYHRTYQLFLILITTVYACLFLFVTFFGHLPNLLLLITMRSLPEITEAFRERQLRQTSTQLATLGAQLSLGLILSITISRFIV